MDYQIRKTNQTDLPLWKDFLKIVKEDFYGLDLSLDERHIKGVLSNIEQGTALFIEDNNQIIGAITFSKEKGRITWLAVHPEYRRLHIASTLVEYMIRQIPADIPITVKTFIESKEGVAARSFYQKMGFTPCEIISDSNNRNGGHSMQMFKLIKDHS